ncbi:MAG: T9SS type A sorting domain-containing protein [Bacteroidia bacterium]|nr:T9SS type A sorting domain-containing protein [Bacteroidia bacterium]
MNLATRLLFIVGALLVSSTMSAQCVPDSLIVGAPGLYPDSLPPITGCQYSETDITFIFPRDTTVLVFGQNFTLPFNFFRIESIQGLPPGMSWSCNLTPDCEYNIAPGNPNPDTMGCIRLFGTPSIPGKYTLIVNLTANVTLLNNPLDQPSVFIRDLVVGPCSFGSDCYTYTLDAACAPATLTLENGLDSAIIGDFDTDWSLTGPNGYVFSSNTMNPSPVWLEDPGAYYLNYSAVVDTFPWQLDSIVIQTVNCSDLLDAPDIYWKFFDPTGTELLNTSTTPISNATLPISINTGNLLLSQGGYSFEVWDDDNIGGDDGCAGNAGAGLTFNAPPATPGPKTIILNGLTVTFWVAKPTLTVACADTFVLAEVPLVPVLEADTTLFCSGDSVLLYTTSADSLVWYVDFQPIPGAADTVLVVKESGFYQVESINPVTLCRSLSDWVYLEAVEVATPAFIYDGNGMFKISSPDPDIEYEWYNDVGVLKGTGSTFQPTNSGIFYAIARDKNTGCTSPPTESLSVILASQEAELAIGKVEVYPNPTEGLLHLSVDLLVPSALDWSVVDVMGRTLLQGNLSQRSMMKVDVSLADMAAGIYVICIRTESGTITRRIRKE